MNVFSEAQSIRFFKHVNASPFWRPVARFGAVYLIWLMILMLVVYFRSFFWIPALFLPWGVSLLLSTWIQRPRPYQSYDVEPVMRPSVETASFPSEHATIAFAIAAVFIPTGPFFFIVLMCAMLVALSRVAAGVHYFSDILVGALIGFSLSTATLLIVILLEAFLKNFL